jgi:nitrite reductase/ring-hydroxylating ferredoxin subunit
VSYVKLARAGDVPPGQIKFVWAGKTPLILANHDGTIHALHGICPHQHQLLDGAILWENLVDCPFHHFQFDVRTGENHFPKNVYPSDMPRLQEQVRPLRKYAAEIRDGDVWVKLG